MVNKKGILIGSVLLLLIININLIYAQGAWFGGAVPSGFYGGDYRVFGSSVNPQFTQPSFYGGSGINVKDYWFDFNRSDCKERQDVILMIPPGGCSPAVVRSDLLEERNVPVFCKVASIQVNPLIDISRIRSIRFTNKQAKGAQVSFFPARAAVRSSRTLEGSPIVENVGYLVISLPRQEVEAEMPDWIGGNVTAVIDYDAEGVFGVGEHDFYLTEMEDDEWERSYKEYGFWKGKGFIRLDSVDVDSARVSIYRDGIKREATVNLKKGETSRDIYLDGYYCAAGMNIKLEDVDYPVDTALLKVDDEDIWVAKGSRFLNGKCRVKSLEVGEVGGGIVRVYCTGVGNVDLMLGGAEVSLEGGEKESGEYSSGDFFKKSKDGRNIYVGYVGKDPDEDGNFVVLVKTSDDKESFSKKRVGATIGKIVGAYADDPSWWQELKRDVQKFKNFWTQLKMSFSEEDKWLKTDEGEFYGYIMFKINDEYDEIPVKDIKILKEGHSGWKDEEIELEDLFSEDSLDGEKVKLEEEFLEEYYDLAVENYNEVFELYPNERKINDQNLETYSEEALYGVAELSRELGLKANQIKYLETLIENYPDSSLANRAEQDLEEAYKGRVSEDSQAAVYINNEVHFISLRDFKKPSYEDLGAELLITDDREDKTFYLRKDELEGTHNSKLGFKITEITEDSVKIKYYPDLAYGINLISPNAVGKTETLEIGKTEQLTSKVSVKLVKTNLNKQAKIKIIPKTFGMRTESDLHFKVGIEKRAIKLSPEKTQEMIDNLDKSIEDWEKINNKLGKVVTGMKGACFATSAMLTVKNLFSGWSGESMARHDVMTSAGGWNEKCRLAVANGEYSSVQKCLLDKNSEIEASVGKLAGYYDRENDKIKEIQNLEGVKIEGTDILGLEDQVDYQKLKQKYCDEVKNDIDWNRKINLTGKGQVSLSDIYLGVDKCDIDLEEMKLLKMRELVDGDPMLRDIMDKKLGSELVYTYDINQEAQDENAIKTAAGSLTSGVQVLNIEGGKSIATQMHTLTNDEKAQFAEGVSKVAYYHVPNNVKYGNASDKYVVVGFKKETEGNVYAIESVNVLEGGVKGGDVKIGFYEFLNDKGISSNKFREANAGLYKNPMKGQPKVKYYERAPYQGLPAQVPFDRENGWYVATDYILSGFGKPYEESGRAINFWICNVGENGLIEFKQGDECRYYNRGTSQDLKFAGLSASESAKLVQKADRAIIEASRQYKKGKEEVIILGQVFGTDIAENGESGRCSDFMSPQDCHLMFNICDPVLCPESRCDYGGEYRVANVVQSGIIGSLLLCLPNAQEGIMVPICLTGVHAGIEGYLSILKMTQACLQENLETGRNIGICDEMKSVFMCDFFWRQAVPLMDVFIPRVFGAFFGQGVRGGGEYMTVDYAWENAKNSIDYFKNDYAVNAMKAFNDRSTSEIGGEVCKSFVSARYPSSKDFFDNLVEPDSPVQYHAWFSENVLTEATIPATSHYKVYYHVYAGKDIGANYVIYLRNPPESAYVHTMGTYVVDRGYLARGGQLDRARDFTGISGYQELCVNVNGQEECGFKQVSTSWAMDELSRRYVEEQAKEGDITSSEECVSGSPSLWSFAQPNLQAGAQEAISPELYKRGIIRVCSSGNPGAQVEPSGELDKTKSTYDRWKRVGDCDSPDIGCWIDTNSVKNVLRDAPDLTDKVLDDVDLGYLGEVEKMLPEEIGPIVDKAEKFELKLTTEQLTKENIDKEIGDIIKSLIVITERAGPTNPNKANAFFLIGKIYDAVTMKVYKERVKQSEVDVGGGVTITDDDLKQGVWIEWKAKYGSCKYKFEGGKWIEELEDSRALDSKVRAAQPLPECLKLSGNYFQGISKIAEKYEKVEIEGTDISGEGMAQEIIKVLRGMAEGKSSSESRTKWTLDSAIEEIKTRKGKYSDNKVFIDELYEDRLLTEKEYNEINGGSYYDLNLEEDMKFVKDKLLEKKAIEMKK